MFFYSQLTNGFYSSEIHGSNMPADAVEITAEEHAALMAGQTAGQEIIADSEGRPVLTDHVQTAGEIAAALSAAAQTALGKSDLTILRCYESGVVVPAEWQAYRAALRAIVSGTSTETELPVMPEYPAGT